MKTDFRVPECPSTRFVADDIASQVTQGVLRPGDRIPSVRQLSRERGLSVTTVLEAYRLLEDRGIIRAQPQSGYFVAWRPSGSARPRPTMSSALAWPAQVTISDLDANILLDSVSQGMVRFGAAFPAVELLPTDRLNRILGSLARRGEVGRDLYASVDGWEELRRQIAQRRSMQGCAMDSNEIIITSGCTESLSLALQVTTKPGDLVAVESPTYFGILQILEVLGLRALEIPDASRNGDESRGARVRAPSRRRARRGGHDQLQQPGGELHARRRQAQVGGHACREGDPADRGRRRRGALLRGQPSHRLQVLRRAGARASLLLVQQGHRPHHRVGWIAPGSFFKRVKHVRGALTSRAPLMMQVVLAEYLSHGGYEHHLRRLRRAYAERVNQMAQAVVDQFPEGTRVSTPAGGYVLWVEMPEAVDALALFRMALEAGISVVPGHLFSVGSHFNNCVRLNAAYWSKRTEPALTRLAEMAQQLADTRSSGPASRLP